MSEKSKHEDYYHIRIPKWRIPNIRMPKNAHLKLVNMGVTIVLFRLFYMSHVVGEEIGALTIQGIIATLVYAITVIIHKLNELDNKD